MDRTEIRRQCDEIAETYAQRRDPDGSDADLVAEMIDLLIHEVGGWDDNECTDTCVNDRLDGERFPAASSCKDDVIMMSVGSAC